MKKNGGIRFLRWLILFAKRFLKDDMPASSAQLTYYLTLALFPFLVFLINLLSYTKLSTWSLTEDLLTVLPAGTMQIITSVIRETIEAKSTTLLSFSALFALFSTSRAMNALNRALNKAYRVQGTRPIWKNAMLSFLFTMGLIVLIVATLSLMVFGQLIGEHLFTLLGASVYFLHIWNLMRYFLPVAIMVLIFSLFYRFMPNTEVRFSNVWRGAVFSTIGWIVASLLFSYYVNRFGSYTRVYGSLGGIIVFLVWLYLSSFILLVGGEINAVLLYGDSKIK
ncbi:YihY/virulence factor BrkB family protein [Clostridia bacterium]|nr:YihY/virulence factor BrkB family protein [Clostridia bacterium]